MSHDPPAEDLRILLQSVEADIARTSPNRNQIRQSALTSFDDAFVAPPENERDFDRATVVPAKDEPQDIRLVSVEDKPRRLTSSRRSIAWAGVAAAAALVLILGLTFVDSRGQFVTTGPTELGPAAPGLLSPGPAATGTAIAEVSEERRLRLDGLELPALMLPGPQSTDTIARGLSFDAPDGLAVIDESDGQLILVLADGAEDNIGRLIIVETELSDLEGLLGALGDEGEVAVKEIRLMVNGRATTRFDVTVTNEAIATRSCTVGEPCIHLQDGSPAGAALWAGADNRIVEIGRNEDAVVLAIEVSQSVTGPLSRLAAQVVNTASLSLD